MSGSNSARISASARTGVKPNLSSSAVAGLSKNKPARARTTARQRMAPSHDLSARMRSARFFNTMPKHGAAVQREDPAAQTCPIRREMRATARQRQSTGLGGRRDHSDLEDLALRNPAGSTPKTKKPMVHSQRRAAH